MRRGHYRRLCRCVVRRGFFFRCRAALPVSPAETMPLVLPAPKHKVLAVTASASTSPTAGVTPFSDPACPLRKRWSPIVRAMAATPRDCAHEHRRTTDIGVRRYRRDQRRRPRLRGAKSQPDAIPYVYPQRAIHRSLEAIRAGNSPKTKCLPRANRRPSRTQCLGNETQSPPTNASASAFEIRLTTSWATTSDEVSPGATRFRTFCTSPDSRAARAHRS